MYSPRPSLGRKLDPVWVHHSRNVGFEMGDVGYEMRDSRCAIDDRQRGICELGYPISHIAHPTS
jgi:hypothetical protein